MLRVCYVMDDAPILLNPIGSISTPFKNRYDAPSQPGLSSEAAQGIVTLHPGNNFEQALEDLAGFEKIWLIYWFDRNPLTRSENTPNWKAKVLPPRGTSVKRGVFATRSPHRPNPIGLSLVDLLGVHGRTLTVGGVDLLDGTPILDIKPYLPYIEAFPNAKVGWIGEEAEKRVSPLDDGTKPLFSVDWSPVAKEQAEWLLREHGIDLLTRAVTVLSSDPFPHPYRRIKQLGTGMFTLAIRSWRVLFGLENNSVHIRYIMSGYSRDALKKNTEEELHDSEAHKAFHECWPEEM